MLPKLLDPRPYFAGLPDPRRETRNKLHKLHDILMIVLCAVLSGVEDGVGMADFAEEKEAWWCPSVYVMSLIIQCRERMLDGIQGIQQ